MHFNRNISIRSLSYYFFGEDVTSLSFNPVKTLESVFRPIFNPMVFKVLKPLREATKLPGILIKKFQALVNSFVNTRETSLKNYVSIGAYYVSKRLLVIVALVILLLVYFIFVKPPAIVNKWFNRVPVVVENTPKAVAFSGDAKIVSTDKKQSRYVGGLADGLYMGTGKLYNESGTLVYEGEFDKGMKAGTGSLYDDSGKLVYKGQFTADQYNGEGTLFQKDRKIRFTGQFQNGKFGGPGKLYNDNGALVYEGAFLEGMYHGAGKLFSQNGQIVYEGDFAANEYNGAGKKYDDQGKLQYEGAFKAGRYAGDGTEYYPNGFVKYKGAFVAGGYGGIGEWNDDKGVLRFKGSFQNGVMTGPGEAYDESGKLVYKGDFAGGLYDGIGILYDKDGGIVLKSFFEKGRIGLQKFIGLPSKKLEDLLGKPAEITLLDQAQPLGAESADSAESSTATGAAAGGAANAGGPNNGAATATGSGTAPGTANGTTSGTASSGSAASGMKFQMIYSDLQYTFLVEPSKSNPKEAVVTELTIWGSKPLSVLQPAIETFKDAEKMNAEGFSVLELQAPFPGGLRINRYYRDDNLYSLTFFAGEKAAHELEIIAIERIKP